MSDLTVSDVMRMYQMDGGGNGDNSVGYKDPEWYSHFERFLIMAGQHEIPRPFMARAKISNGYFISSDKDRLPVLGGGLSPYGERYEEEGKVWVYVVGAGHYWADMNIIETPDLVEYHNFFKKDIEDMRFYIKNNFNKALGEEISKVAVVKKNNKKK